MLDILFDRLFCGSDRRAVGRKQHRQFRQREQPMKRIEVLLHVSLRRIDHDGSDADYQIASYYCAGDFFVEAEMSARMPWSMKSPQPPTWITLDLDQVVVFDEPVDLHHVLDRLGRQSMSGHGNVEPGSKMLGPSDVIRMKMSQNYFSDA